MLTDVSKNQQSLVDFFETIYRDGQGFVYLATKTPVGQSWNQEFYEWPNQKSELVAACYRHRNTAEVYFGPALFRRPAASKADVLGSFVYWVEFDGQVPTDLQGVPAPTIRICSSGTGHEHWYWLSQDFIEVDNLEHINRSLTYFLQADVSGWDANQVLRPPDTINHKRDGVSVTLLEMSEGNVSSSSFSALPLPPPVLDLPEITSIPAVEEVIAKYAFSESHWRLFKDGPIKPLQRSMALMALGHALAEMKMSAPEMLAVLINADKRWGKFGERPDQLKRLNEIVTRAKAKHPGTVEEIATGLIPLGLKSLLETEVNLEWLWTDYLEKNGYMLLTGPSGIGKTQFALDFSMRACLGLPFLEKKTAAQNQEKIGFFSLEMGLTSLKYFIEKQVPAYTSDEIDELQQRFLSFPLGEPLYMSEPGIQALVEKCIETYGLTGIVVDSLGSTTSGTLSDEAEAKKIMDWNDRLRARYGIFSVFIHHNRKASGDNKKPNKLADVYGSHYFTARSTTVFCLWDGGGKNALQLLPLKIRLAERPDPFIIYRDSRLRFTKKETGVTLVPIESSAHETEATEKPAPNMTEGGLEV